MCATEHGFRPKWSQVIRIKLPCIPASWCAFAEESFSNFKKGVLGIRITKPTFSCTYQLKTKQSRKQDKKTRRKDQNKVKKIIKQNIIVLIPLLPARILAFWPMPVLDTHPN